MNEYLIGNTVLITATFTDDSQRPIDPPGVFLSINKAGERLTYQYGVGQVISRDTTGTYSSEVVVDKVGGWDYYWFSSGTYSANDGQFLVVGSGV